MAKLNDLVKTGFNRQDLATVLNVDILKGFADAVKSVIAECDDVDVLKAAAIEFDGVTEFFGLEDKLVGLIGDEYYDFAEEHDLT